ncbi:MAG: lysophospholipid acyltransferase family protein [Enhygromyxa sp.]
MPRPLRILLSGISFLLFYGGASVIAWVVLPILRWRIRALPQAEQQAAIDQFLRGAYRLTIDFMAAVGLFRFRLPDLSKVELPPPPYVVVANHPTLLDVLFIKALLPGVVVLVKAALFKAPSLRRLFEASGDFKGPASEEQRFGTTAVLDTFVERLEAGRSVIVFPEGTRSPAWRLRRFRRGAAEAAVQSGAAIVPIFILADPPVLKKGDKWYDMPKQVPSFELELLEPITDTRGRDSKQLIEGIRDQLAERLEAARLRSVERHREGR